MSATGLRAVIRRTALGDWQVTGFSTLSREPIAYAHFPTWPAAMAWATGSGRTGRLPRLRRLRLADVLELDARRQP